MEFISDYFEVIVTILLIVIIILQILVNSDRAEQDQMQSKMLIMIDDNLEETNKKLEEISDTVHDMNLKDNVEDMVKDISTIGEEWNTYSPEYKILN